MDIKALLSPQDSAATETPPPVNVNASPLQSPGKRAIRQPPPRRTSSNLSQQITSAPTQQQQFYHANNLPNSPLAQHAYHSHHLATASPLPSPGLSSLSNGRTVHNPTSTPPVEPRASLTPLTPFQDPRSTPPYPHMVRQNSTPQMDTLADLASMQHDQQAARQNAGGLRDPQIYQAQRPSITLQNIPRSLSGNSVTSVTMEQVPAKPRVFDSTSLSAGDCEALNKLAQTLLDAPYDHQSHKDFITLLHRGFLAHIESGADPLTYDLLSDLRQAYSTMDKMYPVGEELWVDWLEDEKTLANDIEAKLSVIELFVKATQDEPYSARLWRMYGDYMYTCFACVHDLEAPENWSEDEKLIGKELFTWEQMMGVWDRAVAATQFRINDSNIVWDRYIEIVLEDHARYPSQEKVRHIEALFSERLMRPHATWDQTSHQLSSFVSTYDESAYEDLMVRITSTASKVKQQYSLREHYEFKLLKAVQEGDQTEEWFAFSKYLAWEKYTQGVFSFQLINALFERATLRFPTADSLWEDHAEFLIEKSDPSVSLLQFLERANRHCPWSGNLWCHRILALETDKRSFREIENVKHSATESGVLESGGMEDLIKVYIAWCGFLRRKAFGPDATEEDADIAEVSIRSALEHVRDIGIKKYGDKFQGDPQYRLERVYIKFFTQNKNVVEARHIWDSLVRQQQDSYDFWYRYYIWEMVEGSNHATRDNDSANAGSEATQRATATLRQGLKRVKTMDNPEALILMFLNHCEQHESVRVIQLALIEARSMMAQVQKRREREATAVTEAYQQAAEGAMEAPSEVTMTDAPEQTSRKRGRSSEPDEETAHKKTKPDVTDTVERQQQDKPKRDRERTTLIVKNLPLDVTQTQLRKHFTPCGKVHSVVLKTAESSTTAVVEFERFDEAEYAAFQAKDFNGTPIEVSIGTNSNLYVANYKPTADEEYLRNLFTRFGDIVDIRLPSLRFDTHRRFAYIQFSNAEEAKAATSLNATEIDGYKIVALISNPGIKKARDGRATIGREIWVGSLEYSSTDDDVKELFSKFGEIEKLRYPKTNFGKGKGHCFVTFSTEEAANKAVAEMDGKKYHQFDLRVNIASDDIGVRAKHHVAVVKFDSASRSPSADPQAHTGDGTGSAECSVHLTNVPDTVNDARIQEVAKKWGPLVKVLVSPQLGGAVIQYEKAADAATASLALNGYEIAPGHKVTVSSVDKNTKVTQPRKTNLVPSFNRSRPVRGGMGGSGGRRGGLGSHRTGLGFGLKTTSDGTSTSTTASKRNDDFRVMMGLDKEKKDVEKNKEGEAS